MARRGKVTQANTKLFPGEGPSGEIAAIESIYDAAGRQMADVLMQVHGRNLTPAQKTLARQRVALILERAIEKARPLVQSLMRKSAEHGVKQAAAAIRKAEQAAGRTGKNKAQVALIQRNIDATVDELVAASATRAEGYILAQREMVGRRTDDIFRKIGLEQTQQAFQEMIPHDGLVKGIKEAVGKSGALAEIEGRRFFLDSIGRRWDPSRYAKMVARTTSREVVTQAFIAEYSGNGYDLVTISSHPGGDDDEHCAPYDGNTFSLTGATPGYDILDDAPPFHPNCLHVITPGPIVTGGGAGDE